MCLFRWVGGGQVARYTRVVRGGGGEVSHGRALLTLPLPPPVIIHRHGEHYAVVPAHFG